MGYIKKFTRKILRVFRWAPAVYRWELWDYSYTYGLMGFIFQELQDFYGDREKVHMIEPARLKILKEITIAKILLQRLQNDEYPDFEYDALQPSEINFIPINTGELFKLKLEFNSVEHEKQYHNLMKNYFDRQSMLRKQDLAYFGKIFCKSPGWWD